MTDDHRTTPVPQLQSKYQQLYEELRQRLVQGGMAFERPIGTEHELADQYGVSRVTVRKALKLLEDEGLIVRKRRLGTFPARRLTPFPNTRNVAKLTEETAWLAAHSDIRLVRFDQIIAPRQVRKMLGLSKAERVRRFARIRFDASGPIAYLTSYLPKAVASQVTKQQLLKQPPLVLLEATGIVVSRTERTVSAELATDDIAQWLEVDEGSPLIRTTLTVLDDEDKPVNYTVARLRADHYELRYTLGKDGSKSTPEVWRLGTN